MSVCVCVCVSVCVSVCVPVSMHMILGYTFSGYELEPKGRPGQFVELSSTLKSQGTMDFVLKHIRK